jgi:hypothetical protein
MIASVIEIRNGTRARMLAHQTRDRLSQQGFHVGMIGNHIDFGAETTVIYYRPGTEKVAQPQTMARLIEEGHEDH